MSAKAVHIREAGGAELLRRLPEFADILMDSVAGGASVGFLPPLAPDRATEYWTGVAAAVESGGRILLIAERDAVLLGAVQLDLAAMPNATHRAEVMKLMVLSRHRGQGLATALMAAAANSALEHGRTLLVLDTRRGDPSERLYRSLGFQEAGAIPRYARSANGELHETVFFYRELTLP